MGAAGPAWNRAPRSPACPKSRARTKKTSKISKKGATAAMNMRPLIATKELSTTLRYQITDGGAAVEIGANRTFSDDVGAEVHQFGTRDGHIPARHFLSLSDSDKATVLT
jgi:phage gpG-like protein